MTLNDALERIVPAPRRRGVRAAQRLHVARGVRRARHRRLLLHDRLDGARVVDRPRDRAGTARSTRHRPRRRRQRAHEPGHARHDRGRARRRTCCTSASTTRPTRPPAASRRSRIASPSKRWRAPPAIAGRRAWRRPRRSTRCSPDSSHAHGPAFLLVRIALGPPGTAGPAHPVDAGRDDGADAPRARGLSDGRSGAWQRRPASGHRRSIRARPCARRWPAGSRVSSAAGIGWSSIPTFPGRSERIAPLVGDPLRLARGRGTVRRRGGALALAHRALRARGVRQRHPARRGSDGARPAPALAPAAAGQVRGRRPRARLGALARTGRADGTPGRRHRVGAAGAARPPGARRAMLAAGAAPA